jgi:hypothetical protein
MKCEFSEGCEFFLDNLTHMPVASDMMKNHYCKIDPAGCARYLVRKKLGADAVPRSLYPNHMDEAQKLLREAGVSDE